MTLVEFWFLLIAIIWTGFALVLLLGALMARGISFEYRGRRDSAAWRRTWLRLLTGGSLLVPLLTFAATTLATATAVLSIFSELYPKVIVTSTSPAYSPIIHNTASGSYAFKVMTVVVAIFLPVLLLYTAWSYYVFRRRISARDFRPQESARPG
jgi:cytochrome bd-type quinol oxidase subunit 2